MIVDQWCARHNKAKTQRKRTRDAGKQNAMGAAILRSKTIKTKHKKWLVTPSVVRGRFYEFKYLFQELSIFLIYLVINIIYIVLIIYDEFSSTLSFYYHKALDHVVCDYQRLILQWANCV